VAEEAQAAHGRRKSESSRRRRVQTTATPSRAPGARVATLVRILEQAGYADEQLAEMQVWIALSFGGYVMAESSRRQGPNAPEVYAALAHLDPEDADRLAVLMPQIDRAFDQMHERFADRLIQTVEAAAPS
jgi:hypothetical protein